MKEGGLVGGHPKEPSGGRFHMAELPMLPSLIRASASKSSKSEQLKSRSLLVEPIYHTHIGAAHIHWSAWQRHTWQRHTWQRWRLPCLKDQTKISIDWVNYSWSPVSSVSNTHISQYIRVCIRVYTSIYTEYVTILNL